MTSSTPPGARPSELLYPDLDAELALTRRMLAVVPDGHNDWKPHEKSGSLGWLATHIASLPGFASTIFSTRELDWATFKYVPPVANTSAERLALFDEKAATMSAQVKGADWPALAEHWVMRAGDKVMMDEPRGKAPSHHGAEPHRAPPRPARRLPPPPRRAHPGHVRAFGGRKDGVGESADYALARCGLITAWCAPPQHRHTNTQPSLRRP